MRYTVTWWRNVEDDLTEIWLSASDKRSISLAADMLEQQLRHDPVSRGAIPLPNNCWALAVPPLRVLYRVRQDDCVVELIWIEEIDASKS